MSVIYDNPVEIEREEYPMRPIRQIIDDLPEVVTVPPALRHRRVEVIFGPLDEPTESEHPPATTDAGIRDFFGCFQAFPEREARGEVGDVSQGRPTCRRLDRSDQAHVGFQINCNPPRLEPSFVDALVRMPVFAQEVTRYSKGVWLARLRLYPDCFFEVFFPAPPIDEQRAIVTHIPARTGKPDTPRLTTETTIALLNERDAALIAAAVMAERELTKAGMV